MARIACIGWGSLIWNPQDLPIQTGWFNDGPMLPLEFARKSNDERITIVIVPGLKQVCALWALINVVDLTEAKKVLRKREGNIKTEHVGYWPEKQSSSDTFNIGEWAVSNNLDGVVWTALPAKFDDERLPTKIEIIEHLCALGSTKRDLAEEYIRKAPAQINTEYRRAIEAKLGWIPQV